MTAADPKRATWRWREYFVCKCRAHRTRWNFIFIVRDSYKIFSFPSSGSLWIRRCWRYTGYRFKIALFFPPFYIFESSIKHWLMNIFFETTFDPEENLRIVWILTLLCSNFLEQWTTHLVDSNNWFLTIRWVWLSPFRKYPYLSFFSRRPPPRTRRRIKNLVHICFREIVKATYTKLIDKMLCINVNEK